MRRQVGSITSRCIWHNYFLHYPLLMDISQGQVRLEKVHAFDLYYLLTRVFGKLLGKFEGYGANAKFDEIFKIADPAARSCSMRLANGCRSSSQLAIPSGRSRRS